MARELDYVLTSSRNGCIFRDMVSTRNQHGHGLRHGHGHRIDSDYHQDRPDTQPCLKQSGTESGHHKDRPVTQTFLKRFNISTYFKDIVTMRNRCGSITWKKYSLNLDSGSKCQSYVYRISHGHGNSHIIHRWALEEAKSVCCHR